MGGEWVTEKLGDFVTLQRGHDLPDEQRRPGRVPVLGSFGITGWHDVAKAPGPGVTVGRSGASFGTVSYSSVDYWPLNTALYVTNFHGNDPRFAYYFLKTFNFIRFNSGSAQPSLNRNFIHPVEISIPPLAEQMAIANLLGMLDDKIGLIRSIANTLQAMVRTLFNSWFVDFDPVHAKAEGRPTGLPDDVAALFPDEFDGGIPKGWNKGKLLGHARLVSGGTPKTEVAEYWGGKIPWASAADVSQCGDVFLIETERTITERGLAESAAQLIPKLATVVVARGATTGRSCIFGREMAMNQTCYALVTTHHHPFWLNCLFESIVKGLVQSGHGSVFDTITTSTLEAARIVVPEAVAIDRFESTVNPILGQILCGINEAATLSVVRDTLLPKLISGELRITDVDRRIVAA